MGRLKISMCAKYYMGEREGYVLGKVMEELWHIGVIDMGVVGRLDSKCVSILQYSNKQLSQ